MSSLKCRQGIDNEETDKCILHIQIFAMQRVHACSSLSIYLHLNTKHIRFAFKMNNLKLPGSVVYFFYSNTKSTVFYHLSVAPMNKVSWPRHEVQRLYTIHK